MIERQPGKCPVAFCNPQAIPQNAVGICHDGFLRDQNPLGFRSGAGRILDIGNIIRPECLKLGERFRQRLQRLMGQDFFNPGAGSARQDMTFKIRRRDDGTGRGCAQHAGDPLHIGIAPPDIHRVGHRTGNQPRILAAKKHRHELRPGLGNYRHPVTALQAGRHQLPRRGQRPPAQLGVGQHVAQNALGGIEVESRQPARRIVKALGNGFESGKLLLQVAVGPWGPCRPGRNRYSLLFSCLRSHCTRTFGSLRCI